MLVKKKFYAFGSRRKDLYSATAGFIIIIIMIFY